MKIINISLSTTPTEPVTLKYQVEYSLGGTSYLAHVGKFFCQTGQTTVQLDLEDVLQNHKFQGTQFIKPVVNAANNQYEMPVSAQTSVTECYYNQVRVSSLDTPTAFTAVTKYFWFIPTQAFGYGFSMDNGLNIPVISDGLIPRIPANPPTGFHFSVMPYNNSNATVSATAKKDTTTIGTYSVYTYRGAYIPLSGATDAYYINDIKVAQVDKCTSPYYLLWLDNKGGLQCQPFLKTTKFSVEYTSKNRVDIRNAEWRVSAVSEGQWALKSRNLTEQEYSTMGQMFDSPYIILLDMENSRLHYVNISKTTYEEKKRTVIDKKPLFFEIEVKSADKYRV